MAVTIQQQPTSPNIADNNLVYTVTSTQVTQPQFQFVVDIKDENDALIQRVKQQPNPSAKGVFNLGNLISNQLGPTDRVWNIDTATANTASAKDIKVLFGEEYGTSTSSSVTLYTPDTSGSEYYFMLNGVLNPLQQTEWNWASGSNYDYEDATDDVTFTHQNGLTRFSTSSIRLEDYHTISFLNGNASGDLPNNQFAQDVFSMVVKEYDESDSLLAENTYYNEVLRPNTTGSFWTDVYTSQSQETRLIHWPAGPLNFEDAGNTLEANTSYYVISFHSQATDGNTNGEGIWGQYRFDVTEKACGYDGVRFAWKNEYGVWDYYNFTLAQSRTSAIERKEYNQTFVDYSTSTNTSAYDVNRRGRSQYYNKVNKIRGAESDYLNQTDADNLREMFYSTDVYVQQADGEWWPIVITTANIVEKTNPRSQKLFKYTVEFSYANDVQARV